MLKPLQKPETEASALAMIAKDRVLWAIMALAALLIFWSLGSRFLWQDEAETALLGKTILKFGRPVAYDGLNVVSQEAGREFNEYDYLWRWSPWLQYYVAAISIGLFGTNTIAARLPFAILGLLTVPATYVLARRLFASIGVARLSAFFLTVCVPFLLHVRQCRWYALFYLLSVFLLLYLARMVRGRRLAWLGFAAMAVLAFYSNYLTGVGMVGGLVAVSLLLRRDKIFVGKLAAALAVIVILCLPGLLFSEVFKHASVESRDAAQREAHNQAIRRQALERGQPASQQPLDGVPRLPKQFLANSSEFFTYLLPLPLFLLLAFFLLRRPRRAADKTLRSASTPLSSTAANGGADDPGARRWALALSLFCLLYLAYVSSAPWMMFRYIGVLAPIAAMLIGLTVYQVFRWNPVAATALAVVLVCTNLVHMVPFALPRTQALVRTPYGELTPVSVPVFPWAVPRDHFPEVAGISSPLFGYLYEITHSFDEGEAAMIRFIESRAQSDDIVLTTYGDLPLQYYTGLQVVGGLQGRLDALPERLNWVIFRGFVISQAPGKDAELYNVLRKRLKLELYDEVEFPWRDFGPPGNCPEPQYHLFRAPERTLEMHVLHLRGNGPLHFERR